MPSSVVDSEMQAAGQASGGTERGIRDNFTCITRVLASYSHVWSFTLAHTLWWALEHSWAQCHLCILITLGSVTQVQGHLCTLITAGSGTQPGSVPPLHTYHTGMWNTVRFCVTLVHSLQQGPEHSGAVSFFTLIVVRSRTQQDSASSFHIHYSGIWNIARLKTTFIHTTWRDPEQSQAQGYQCTPTAARSRP